MSPKGRKGTSKVFVRSDLEDGSRIPSGRLRVNKPGMTKEGQKRQAVNSIIYL